MESGHENGPPAGLPAQGPVRTALSAEAVGFEPTVTSLPRRFSRPFPSAARAHLPAPAGDRRRGDQGNGSVRAGRGQLAPTRAPRVSSVVGAVPSWRQPRGAVLRG